MLIIHSTYRLNNENAFHVVKGDSVSAQRDGNQPSDGAISGCSIHSEAQLAVIYKW